LLASLLIVGLLYPFFEGLVWNGNFGMQSLIEQLFGSPFHDFAGSIVVHAVGGWIGLAAVLLLGPRQGRYRTDGGMTGHPPSSIPFLSIGAWTLTMGWFGFNVMSAQTVEAVSGLVAVNSLMAMVGGILAALVACKNDPGFLHNGPLAGLVAVCAGSDLMHPIGALVTGAVAGGLFVYAFTLTQNKWRIDDVLGVWPLHGLCGLWGGIAAGIFGLKAFGGVGGVTFAGQLVGSFTGVAVGFGGGLLIYGAIKSVMGLRLSQEDEYLGADLSIHKITAQPDYNRGDV
jgi:Amt family ammonium transporter